MFFRKLIAKYKLWEFNEVRTVRSNARNVMLIKGFISLLESLPDKALDINHRKLVGKRVNVYTPNLVSYIDYLLTVHNSMSKGNEIFLWDKPLYTNYNLFDWYTRNRVGENDYEKPLVQLLTILRKIEKQLDDSPRFSTPKNQRRLTFVVNDLMTVFRIIELNLGKK